MDAVAGSDSKPKGPSEEGKKEGPSTKKVDLLESGIQEKGMKESSSTATMNATATSQTSMLALSPEPPPMKRLKLEVPESLPNSSESLPTRNVVGSLSQKEPPGDSKAAVPVDTKDDSGVVSPENPTPSTITSSAQLSKSQKPVTFGDLGQKYLAELEYMLREFQKLEKQLLGAKTINSVESAGSRERREKLHSFILHLQDTVDQIRKGCQLESGKAEPEDSSKASVVQEKETDRETVQKLEEHILTNLLPVKVRLKKQLAAQQGAVHNPTNMPVRGVVNSETAGPVKGTFLKAPEDKTQFGKPLAGGGSTLTQKLHGQTLGSKSRIHGHGVGSAKTTQEKPKILFAGLAVGSEQLESSVSAATTAHQMFKDPSLVAKTKKEGSESTTVREVPPTARAEAAAKPDPVASATGPEPPSNQSSEERRLVRKKRRKRKLLREQASIREAQAQAQQPKRKKASIGKSRGPRTVEYMCAHCNENYNSTCEYNPWWALSQHDCPKCRKSQIPRIDISAPANAIEYHPALLAHAEENTGGVHATATPQAPPSNLKASFPVSSAAGSAEQTDSDGMESDLSDDDGILSDMDSVDSDDTEALEAMSPSEKAERENFGAEYSGPKLSEDESARLLILMQHASTCPCRHESSSHRELCRSVKWMMMHVRDCPGTTASFDVCPFPWCRKVKHLLYHLVSCANPKMCRVCNPSVSPALAQLRGLNRHRFAARGQARSASSAEVQPSATTQPHGSRQTSTAQASESMPPPSSLPAEHKRAASVSSANRPSADIDEDTTGVAELSSIPTLKTTSPSLSAISSQEAAATAHAAAAELAKAADMLVTSIDVSSTEGRDVDGDGPASSGISSDHAKAVSTEDDTEVDAETWSVVAGLQDTLDEARGGSSPERPQVESGRCQKRGREDSPGNENKLVDPKTSNSATKAAAEHTVSVTDKALHPATKLLTSETSSPKLSTEKGVHEGMCEAESPTSSDLVAQRSEQSPVASEGASEAVCVQ